MPPKPYTEATLLRAMETAGKLVDNEELRDALKENGIGRPSTRAAIIETLFKRNYIRKERKNLMPTQTGIDLIQTIQDEMIKSAELTGVWEKKLREIEKGHYEAKLFMEELKQMVNQVVANGKNAAYKQFTIEEKIEEAKEKPKKERKPAAPKENKPKLESKDEMLGKPCPLCGVGTIIKGKTAYGCSEWKTGCTWRQEF
jgi:DNA topoisomerase-3